MTFACLYIPDFYAQAVARLEPELHGRALAVVETAPPPFRVFALNEAARRVGAEPGMSRVEVAEIPGVEVRRRSPASEESAHAALLDLARSFSPRFEDLAVDTVTLDLAGLEALLGAPEEIARRVRESAQELGLESSVALAPNPDTARLAAHGFAGITLIGAGEEAGRLGGLPVSVLDPSPEMLETLERWGIRTFRALAALPPAELSERLGQEGVRLQRLARGARLRALVPAPEPLHFEEAMDLDYPVAELDPLAFILGRLLNQLCARLAARGRATQELRLALALEAGHEERQIEPKVEDRNSKIEIRKSKFETGNSETQTAPVKDSAHADPRVSSFDFRVSNFNFRVSDSEFRILRLPFPTCNARLLLKLWLLDLEAKPPSAPVLKVALKAEPVGPRVVQGDLFLPRAPDPQKLELTLARLKGVVGEDRAGSPELLDTHRPDALRIRKFNEVGDSREIHRSKAETRNSKIENRNSKPDAVKSKVESQKFKGGRRGDLPGSNREFRVSSFEFRVSHLAMRLFRPPLAAQVELHDGRPVRVEARRERGQATRGVIVRGHVTASAGPWRTSGDWWTDQPWERDEWDIEVVSRQLSVVSCLGSIRVESRRSKVERTQLYRIYRDLKKELWFVEGLYD